MGKFDQIFYQKLRSYNYIKGWRIFLRYVFFENGETKNWFLTSMTVFYIEIDMIFYKVILFFFVSLKFDYNFFLYLFISIRSFRVW